MADNGIGDLNPNNLLKELTRLRRRVAALEAQARVMPLTMVLDGRTLGSADTSYVRLAWTTFPRSGAKPSVDLHVTLSGAVSLDLALRAAGSEIGAVTVTGTGPVALTGYLPDGWEYGERAQLDVYGKLNSPSGSASGSVVVTGAAVR
ncbi:hypothetical protein ACQP25_44435 (plasmid) [Microtetraspora malaysiensis]|uniref:hypothetical protein n=1 Tax=Microtetraspora malaysiensis TaxID=161358 RepID=UPI003D8B7089